MAIIVSFNGHATITKAVAALREQVGHVYIVDNGSQNESLAVLDALEREPTVTVTRLGQNRGIGYALNLGVDRARALGYRWLLTMDQDSVVDRGMMQEYAVAIASESRCVCLTPNLSDKMSTSRAGLEVARYAITSGNLVRMDVFEAIGPYNESLFIDCIDLDFSLRLRQAGYVVHRVANARMAHQLGEPADLPRLVRKVYTRHSVTRRYYMFRNYMYLAERHMLRFPVFILKLGLLHVILAVLVVLFDPTPFQSLRAMARGIHDYVTRKSGPYREGSL